MAHIVNTSKGNMIKLDSIFRTLDINTLKKVLLENPKLLSRLKKLFGLAVEALRSTEGKRLAAEYRDFYNPAKHSRPTNLKGTEYSEYFRKTTESQRIALLEFIRTYITITIPIFITWPRN